MKIGNSSISPESMMRTNLQEEFSDRNNAPPYNVLS